MAAQRLQRGRATARMPRCRRPSATRRDLRHARSSPSASTTVWTRTAVPAAGIHGPGRAALSARVTAGWVPAESGGAMAVTRRGADLLPLHDPVQPQLVPCRSAGLSLGDIFLQKEPLRSSTVRRDVRHADDVRSTARRAVRPWSRLALVAPLFLMVLFGIIVIGHRRLLSAAGHQRRTRGSALRHRSTARPPRARPCRTSPGSGPPSAAEQLQRLRPPRPTVAEHDSRRSRRRLRHERGRRAGTGVLVRLLDQGHGGLGRRTTRRRRSGHCTPNEFRECTCAYSAGVEGAAAHRR